MSFLPANEAWTILGKDPEKVLLRLARLPRHQRVSAAEEDLEEAQKLAKKLWVIHHPDRGGDADIFKRVSRALESLTYHTQEFKRKMALLDGEMSEKASRRVLIRMGE